MNLAPPDWIPRWGDVVSALRNGRSAIAHAPRHSLQTSMLRYLTSQPNPLPFDVVVQLQPEEYIRGGHLDWSACADAFAQQLDVPFTEVTDSHDIGPALAHWLQSQHAPAHVLVTVGGGPSRTAEARFDLVCFLHELLIVAHRRLAVAVLDDYSLYHYENWRTQGVSRWDFFDRVYLRPVTKEEIVTALGRVMPGRTPRSLSYLASGIEETTGGHPSLALELIQDVHTRGGKVPPRYFQEVARTRLETTQAIESMRRSLQQDSGALVSRAIQYETPAIVSDNNDPVMQTLRMLGVLQWTSMVRARLCPGLVTTLVRDVHDATTGNRRSQGYAAPALIQSPAPSTEHDLTVLHVSDIHIGEAYAFRLPGGEGGLYASDRDAGKLLVEDLDALGIDHVDAIVLSGDLTCQAVKEEFESARHVFDGVLHTLGVDWSQVVVVAGNHDVRWHPQAGEKVHPETGVSRDGYGEFRTAVGKGTDTQAELTVVVSRAGTTALRILSLDSNYVEGPEAGGIGFVSGHAIQQAEALLKEDAAARIGVERTLTWIAVHHHVLPVTSSSSRDAFNRKLSVMANAPALLSFAARWDAEVILHGHEHQPLLTLARRWPVERATQMRSTLVAGAGSFGCGLRHLGLFGRNHYFIHVRRQHDLLVRSRMTGDEGLGWVTHGDLLIPMD